MALVRVFFRVESAVDFCVSSVWREITQIVLRLKTFIAVRKAALERLFGVMSQLVALQSTLIRKTFPAIWVGATKRLLSRVNTDVSCS